MGKLTIIPVLSDEPWKAINWRKLYKPEYHYLVEEAIDDVNYCMREVEPGVERFSDDGEYWHAVFSWLTGAAPCVGVSYDDLLA